MPMRDGWEQEPLAEPPSVRFVSVQASERSRSHLTAREVPRLVPCTAVPLAAALQRCRTPHPVPPLTL